MQQTGLGNHSIDLFVTGSNKTVNITQQGSGNHNATISLSGESSSVSLTQSGSVPQNFTLINNCTTPGGCAPIVITQH